MCTSNMFAPKGTVDVYDSLTLPAYNTNSMSLKKQLAVILKCKELSFKVQHIDVQRQIGSPAADCGLFSIAFAVCLCNKLDPHAVGFDQS